VNRYILSRVDSAIFECKCLYLTHTKCFWTSELRVKHKHVFAIVYANIYVCMTCIFFDVFMSACIPVCTQKCMYAHV